MERSSEQELQKNDGVEREVAEWEWSRERGLEHGAGGRGAGVGARSGFFAAHAPLTRSSVWPEQTLDSLVRFGQM